MAGFYVTFDLGHTFVNSFLPDDASSVLIQAVNSKTVLRTIVGGGRCLCWPMHELGIRGTAYRSRNKDAIAPDDRARMAETWDRSLPQNVN